MFSRLIWVFHQPAASGNVIPSLLWLLFAYKLASCDENAKENMISNLSISKDLSALLTLLLLVLFPCTAGQCIFCWYWRYSYCTSKRSKVSYSKCSSRKLRKYIVILFCKRGICCLSIYLHLQVAYGQQRSQVTLSLDWQLLHSKSFIMHSCSDNAMPN